MTKKITSFLSFSILILFVLVLAAIVPHSFAISLVGFVFCFILILFKQPLSLLDLVSNKINNKNFFILFYSWIFLILIACCVNAWARFVSPGYDLYWFTQAISQAKETGVLKTSSERFYRTLLMQHWEPILYTAVPFAFILKSSVVSVFWQGIGFIGGSIGAFKLSQFLFSKSNYPKAQFITTALYGLSFATINPLSFDVHPPVFGGLLFIPWIIYFILQNKKLIPILLLLLLAQCGEVFLAIFTTYLAYLFVQNKISPLRILFSVVTLISGYLILSFYQKYLGPWWSGLPYNYASRYGNIGGDGFGIITYFIHHPLYVLSQIFEKEKLKTFLKILLYSGPFFLFSLKSRQYGRLSFFILLGCLPYFLEAGLSRYNLMYATNTHYISALGSQWWALTTLGLYAFLTEPCFLKLREKTFQTSVAALAFAFYFLNSSEWRKSPIYPLRGIFEREMPANNVRNYLTNLEKNKGILFTGTEWLCPLVAFHHAWVLCEDGSGYFEKMNLDVVVAREGSLEPFFYRLSQEQKNSDNGKKLFELICEEKGELNHKNWETKIISSQTPHKEKPILYKIYEHH